MAYHESLSLSKNFEDLVESRGVDVGVCRRWDVGWRGTVLFNSLEAIWFKLGVIFDSTNAAVSEFDVPT